MNTSNHPEESSPVTDTSGLSTHITNNNMVHSGPLNNIAATYIQAAIFIAGILGNGVTFAVLQRMWMSPLCNILITSLCVTDFFCCVFGLENCVLEALFFRGTLPRGHWTPAHLAVVCMYYLYIALLCMSSATVVLISVIRNYSLRHPLKCLHRLTPQRVVRAVVAVDTCVFVLFLPVTIHILWLVCYEDTGSVSLCSNIAQYLSRAHSLQYYLLLLIILFGPVATLLNLIYWFKLKQAIKLSTLISNRMQQLSDVKKRDQNRRTMRVTMMFLYILIFNGVCVLPFSIDKIINLSRTGEDSTVPRDSGMAGFDVAVHLIIAILPSCNLWVYLAVNQYFRKEFKEMVFCKTNLATDTSSSNSIKV